jgi:hypothetical protein
MDNSEQSDVPKAEELISEGLSRHKKTIVRTGKSKGFGTWPYYWRSGR